MKPVTIESMKARIAQIEANQDGMKEYGFDISMPAKFELACLRKLVKSLEAKPVVYSLIFRNMEGKLNDYVNANTTFYTLEKAQAYGKGGNYVRQEDGSCEWVANPALDPVVVPLYAEPQPLTTSEREELENYRNAKQVVPEWTNEQCLEFLSIAFRHAEIKGDLEMDDIRLGVKMVNACRAAMLHGKAEPVPATDNTAQQFEALPTGKLESRRRRNRQANARARAKETPEQANQRRAANRDRMLASRGGK